MIRIAHTQLSDAREAVKELRSQLDPIQPRLLLCFSSTRQDPHEMARRLKAAYPDAAQWGGSTAGELSTGRMTKGSTVCMALDSAVVDRVGVAALREVGTRFDLDEAFASLQRHFDDPIEELDPEQHVGLVIADGLSGVEERLIEALAERTEIPFLGGSAGDDLKFQNTHVYHAGNAIPRGATILLMRIPAGYEILKTQSFQQTGKFLEATEVDQATRTIVSFDGRPAAYAYAEAVGALPNAISEKFASSPLARIVGGEPFVRSPRNLDGTAIRFYCAVQKGERLAVMQATDILADTRAVLAKALSGPTPPRGIVDFHCILRALELDSRGQAQEYADLFGSVPMVGFCTYGEACTTHVNQTSTMLLFR